MNNFDLDSDNNKWCKTLHYKCTFILGDGTCEDCKFVKLIDGKLQTNYDHFDETNICSECGGTGKLIVPKWAVENFKEDEILSCYACLGTGLQTKKLRNLITFQKSEAENYKIELKNLLNLIKITSKCSTGHGERNHTLGGIPCKECGLEGMMPWGG